MGELLLVRGPISNPGHDRQMHRDIESNDESHRRSQFREGSRTTNIGKQNRYLTFIAKFMTGSVSSRRPPDLGTRAVGQRGQLPNVVGKLIARRLVRRFGSLRARAVIVIPTSAKPGSATVGIRTNTTRIAENARRDQPYRRHQKCRPIVKSPQTSNTSATW